MKQILEQWKRDIASFNRVQTVHVQKLLDRLEKHHKRELRLIAALEKAVAQRNWCVPNDGGYTKESYDKELQQILEGSNAAE